MSWELKLMTSPAALLKPETWAWHLLGLVNPLIVIAGNLAGGPWVAAGLIFMLGLGPVLDLLLGKAIVPRPPRQSGRPFEVLLYLHAVLQLAAVATLLAFAHREPSPLVVLIAALSTGVSSGASGLVVAHELGHRRKHSLPWWIARLNLLSVMYLHFTTEHNRTHHKHVATVADPASARKGESVWWFVARTVPGQFLNAWQLQAQRGHSPLTNPIARGAVLQLVLLGGILLGLGPIPAVAFFVQAAFAVFLLEYINYIRHYGLHRDIGERQTAAHSWQSEHRWSRWTLLELTRHPAHHLEAGKPFWQLQPLDEAPQLPTGYYGCFWIALVPPLWRRLIHPRIPVVARDPG